MVIDEEAVPSIYWQPGEPRLNRHDLALTSSRAPRLRCSLSDPESVLSVRTTVMGFSAKQLTALERNLDRGWSAPARPMAASSRTSRAGT